MKRKSKVIQATKEQIGEVFKAFLASESGEIFLNICEDERAKLIMELEASADPMTAFSIAKEIKGNNRILRRMMQFVAYKIKVPRESPVEE